MKQFVRRLIKLKGHTHPFICVTRLDDNKLQVSIRDYQKGFTIGFKPMSELDFICYGRAFQKAQVSAPELLSKNDRYFLFAWTHVTQHYIIDRSLI